MAAGTSGERRASGMEPVLGHGIENRITVNEKVRGELCHGVV